MKTIVTLATTLGCAILIASSAIGQVLFEENFSYTPASSLNGQGGWSAHSGAGTNPPQITSGGLSYTGYASSGIGNAVSFTTNGEDNNRPFLTFPNGIASGSVYYSLMVKLDSVATTGDYFFHLYKSSTIFTARIFAKRAANANIRFGIGRSSTAANIAYSDSIYTTGTTHLLVVKYTVIAGATNDTVALWINPTLGGLEPSPTVLESSVDRTTVDVDTVYGVAVRQGTAANAPIGSVDGIRVGQTWNDAPLPVQISSFTGTALAANTVRLNWTTMSEVNNYGFFVEKRSDSESGFTEIPNSFIAGHGTTNLPQHYTYTDNTVSAGRWEFRLRQVDLDGSTHYTEPIHVDVVTGVSENAPHVFALQQNYPNPFNPETQIRFSVENTGRATMHVYNLIGQEVATLFDGIAEAGRLYDVRLSGAKLTSGVYFYKLESGKNSALKKLLLLK